jgi:hypothetical protein
MIIRKLSINDWKDYRELILSFNTYSGIKLSDAQKDQLLNNSEASLEDRKTIIIGAYEDDKLIHSVGGFYPEKFLHWYAFRHLSLNVNNNLLGYKLNFITFSKCMDALKDFAEQNQYYSFYSRRVLKDQLIIDKINEKLKNVGVIKDKYDYYYEIIYKTNESCKSQNHNFYFNNLFPTFESDTVICLFTLRQSYRKVLLKLRS